LGHEFAFGREQWSFPVNGFMRGTSPLRSTSIVVHAAGIDVDGDWADNKHERNATSMHEEKQEKRNSQSALDPCVLFKLSQKSCSGPREINKRR